MNRDKRDETADVEAERAVLGCVITLSDAENARATMESTGPLPPEAFTESRRYVWEAALALVNDGLAVDHLTLADRLKARGKLVECGGSAALMSYDQGVPLTHNLPSYVAILRDRLMRRRGFEAIEAYRRKLADLGSSPEDASISASNVLQTITAERPLERAGSLVHDMIDFWESNFEAMRNGGAIRTATLPWPHENMDSGLPVDKLSVVAGRSGNFKTGLVSDAIWHWGHTLNKQGGVIGLEDGCSWFLERLTARKVSVPYEQIGYARLDEGQQVALQNWCSQAYDSLERNVFKADDKTLGGRAARVTFGDVFSMLQRWADAGAEWAVIDHGLCIDWMAGNDTGGRSDRYDLAIGSGLRALSRLANRSKMAIVMLWHLNRSQDEGTMPKRSDLAESRYLDAEARKIYVVWKQQARPGFQLCTTVKATKGKEGHTVALPLTDAPYGLLGLRGGYVVDFEAEEAERKVRADAERAAKNASGRGFFGRGK
jgi:replicative DNA helicase